jgi:hypothetical protein
MKIYFSGSSGLISTPEALVPKLKPRVMLTYYDLEKKREGAQCRLDSFLKQKKNKIYGNKPGKVSK